ncbi:MAG: hypothetical protein JJ863_22480 [Deltaproteobacteria bacterium]|nr:hypothetical protein [Deltaproteobacteria bacterium]
MQKATSRGPEIPLGPVVEEGAAKLYVDEALFPLDVVYGVCSSFLGRAYVRLERTSDGVIEVRLLSRDGRTPPAAVCGEFANELLNQAIRRTLADRTRRVRDAYMSRSFADRDATLEALLGELDDDDLADDELELPLPGASSE